MSSSTVAPNLVRAISSSSLEQEQTTMLFFMLNSTCFVLIIVRNSFTASFDSKLKIYRFIYRFIGPKKIIKKCAKMKSLHR